MIRPLFIFATTLFLLLCHPAATQSQPNSLQFERFTTQNGLSQDIIRCLHRDRLGFLWIGTENGLNQFDGYSIKVYKHIPNDTSTLPSDWISGICDYGEEDLLITTAHGISIYHRATDSFEQRPLPLFNAPDFTYASPKQDTRGNYWALQFNQIITIRSGDFTQVSSFDIRSIGDSSHVNTLFVDSKGRILVGTDSLLLVFEPGSAVPRLVRLSDMQLSRPRRLSITSIAENPPGTLWLGTKMGLYRYEVVSGIQQFISLSEDGSNVDEKRDLVHDLKWDRSGLLWVAGFGGLYRYSPILHRSVNYYYLQENSSVFAHSRVYCLLIDPADILWAGTWNDGLCKKNLSNEQFGLLRHSLRTPLAGGDSKISAIYEDPGGTLWLGGQEGGVTVIVPSMTTFRHLSSTLGNPQGLSGSSVSAIAGDSAGNVWIASTYNTFDWYNIRSKTMRHIRLPSTEGKAVSILSMLKDPAGFLWLGTEANGVFRFDPRTEQFLIFGQASTDSMSHIITSAWSFFSDRVGSLWIGGWVGNSNLHNINTMTGGIRSYAQPELASARSIVGDIDNNLWIGSWGHGLTKFNPTSGVIRNYTEQNGLPSNYVKGILRDHHGILWISTERGLSRFNPHTEIFRNYNVSDGLQGNFFYSGSCLNGRNGKFYFGGTNGLNAFFPDSIRDADYVAPVVLTSFRIFDKQIFFEHSLSRTLNIELSHDDNLFAFEYVSLDFRAPARHQYAYMLEGFNNDWIQAGTRRYASYTHLDPREYVFMVKGTNSDGVWSSNVATVRLTIMPAFWQTWWFRVGSILLIVVLLFALYRFRLNKLLEIERTRAAIATDLHDDIGTSLTNIALFSDLAQRDVALGSSDVTHRLEKISQTSRSLLDSMNDIVWSIKPENDALEQTILRMEDYAVEMLEENGIDLHVQIPNHLKTLKLPMAVRRNLFLIFKEAIGNVLKHAKATHVDVTIAPMESGTWASGLQVIIADNGKGFDPSTPSSGNGLQNMELRTRNLGGTLSIISDGKRGTSVDIRFPIKSHK